MPGGKGSKNYTWLFSWSSSHAKIDNKISQISNWPSSRAGKGTLLSHACNPVGAHWWWHAISHFSHHLQHRTHTLFVSWLGTVGQGPSQHFLTKFTPPFFILEHEHLVGNIPSPIPSRVSQLSSCGLALCSPRHHRLQLCQSELEVPGLYVLTNNALKPLLLMLDWCHCRSACSKPGQAQASPGHEADQFETQARKVVIPLYFERMRWYYLVGSSTLPALGHSPVSTPAVKTSRLVGNPAVRNSWRTFADQEQESGDVRPAKGG